jgi:hypothetical protein
MSNALDLYVAIWIVLAAVVILLALYRITVDKREYTVLHVRTSELSLIPKQVLRTEQLGRIDHWGKILTGVAVAYGFALAVAYFYAAL